MRTEPALAAGVAFWSKALFYWTILGRNTEEQGHIKRILTRGKEKSL